MVKNLDIAFNNKDIEAVLACYEDQGVIVININFRLIETGNIAMRSFFEKIFAFNGVAK